MEWNLRINKKPVRWQISNTVAVSPSSNIPPLPLEAALEMDDEVASEVDNNLSRKQQSLNAFVRAGWGFVDSLMPMPPPPDNVGGPSPLPLPGGKATRQVFTTETGELVIETDVATVQLNAAAKTSRATAEKVLAEDGLKIVHELSFAPHLYAVRLPSNRSLPEVITQLQAKPSRYVFAEPSCLQRINERDTPTDPRFIDQWHHASVPNPDGTGGFGLHSVDAWNITKGVTQDGRAIRIAIIDTGMDINHRDLEGRIVDGGFFTSDSGTGTPTFVRFHTGMDGFPPRGHGTMCMGMAGAKANNDNGGCGIAPDSALIAIAFALNNTGNQLALARAIQFAVNPSQVDPEGEPGPGADVISCSLGVENTVETVLEMAINSATTGRGGLGVPIFWAVSNVNEEPISDDPVCSLANVIAVGSSRRNGGRDACAKGPKLEFLAPGVDILAPTVGTLNVRESGTSFATPLAAGVAALVLSRHPDWTAQEVLQHLRDTCDRPNGQVRNDLFGFGRLNAFRAVQ